MGVFIFIAYLPSKSVVVPLVVPSTRIETPGSKFPKLSVTSPETITVCDREEIVKEIINTCNNFKKMDLEFSISIF